MDAKSISMLVGAVQLLRKPAGDDPRFASFKAIKENWLDFVPRVHTAFGLLQMLAIAEIMRTEGILREGRKDKDRKRQLLQVRRYWRKIADSIAWQLVGNQRHVIKRMCGFQEHPFLADCNPDSAIGFLEEFNKDRLQFALWADATSCIDAGDMLLRDVRKPGVTLAELKEGEANRKASAALACQRAREFFLAEYGEKGQEQLDRIVKQAKKQEAVVSLLNTDNGVDPFSNLNVKLRDVSTPDEDYGEDLSNLINASKLSGISVGCVDSCLWVAAVSDANISHEQISAAISRQALSGAIAERSRTFLHEFFGKQTPYPLHDIRENFSYPIARPFYLANISTDHLIEVLLGRVRIIQYFDWTAFADMASSAGIKFEWSTQKVGRRMRAQPESSRPLVLGDRVPMVIVGEAKMMLGATQLVRVHFDLIRPETMLKQFAEYNSGDEL